MFLQSILRRSIAFIACRLLRIRYKVEIEGKEFLQGAKKGTLVLPNHPAEIDPILLISELAPYLTFSPTVIEHFYYYPGMGFFNRLLESIPIPGFDRALNKHKLDAMAEAETRILKRLKQGGNVLLYPSGKLKLTAVEEIGGASLTHKICQHYPEVNLLFVRITGLWGSNLSKAFSAASPDFWQVVRAHIKDFIYSGLFFMPKRKVLIQIYPEPSDFPKHGSRYQFNRYLEDFYNRYPVDGKILAEEPLFDLPYRPFEKKKEREIVCRDKAIFDGVACDFDPHIREKIFAEMGRIIKKDPSKISLNDRLSQDLGLDSLDAAELFTYLEKNFDLDSQIEPSDLSTVQDLLIAAHGTEAMHKDEAASALIAQNRPQKGWSPKRPTHKAIVMPKSTNILGAFLETCDRYSSFEVATDPQTPPLSYKKFKMGVIALQKIFARFEGEHIGILLPSSVGASIIYFALLAAGKKPIFLNWTTGAGALSHIIDLLKIEEIVTSRKFMDRLHDVDLGKAQERLLFIESLKEQIGLKDKISVLLQARLPAHKLMAKWKLSCLDPNETAIILMTSGTSRWPKAVPLTHANILSNFEDLVRAVSIDTDDVLFSMLPPFHSFGFTIGIVIPLVLGARVCFYPDPKDPKGILKMTELYKPTIFPGAPTFLHNILKRADKKQLSSIRLFVTGAEAASKEFLQEAGLKLPETGCILEGYGCTECSPVITVNRTESTQKGGIGIPLDSYEVVILHPETYLPVGRGEKGLLCVRGPAVFPGYIGEESSPFIEVGGKKFYNTGDLVSIGDNGNFHIHGRLKRFAKIGGEMVSLVAIEEVLNQFAKSSKMRTFKDDKLDFAVVAKEVPGGKTQLVLFSRMEIEVSQVNAILREKGGFSNLVKITTIIPIQEIPVNAGGKIVFGKLEEKAKGIKT